LEASLTVPFRSILCGVEGNESSTEAARQAIALARAGAELRFIAVYASFELGPDSARDALEGGLDQAVAMAGEEGIEASSDLLEGRYAVDVLLPEGAKHDLLVLGTHGKSRAAGIVLGSTASEAARGTEHPLLIARKPPEGAGFPGKVLLATDGSPGSWAPARTAARLATAYESELELVYVGDGSDIEAGNEVESQAGEIRDSIGSEPRLTQRPGHGINEIVEEAEAGRASLIVCGRRGLRGIKALGSVSERVVHQAPCSVLLIPAGPETGA
jgi:nucleotide-binding universal stress UspA family protein